jgi:hypothetical protein
VALGQKPSGGQAGNTRSDDGDLAVLQRGWSLFSTAYGAPSAMDQA